MVSKKDPNLLGHRSARPNRATLRDVAEAAGVSVWTASNTFSNPDRVAEATRERVLAAADSLDYAGPNPGARTLALGRTGMVALIAPQDAQPLLTDPGASLVAQGLLAICDRADLSLVCYGAEHMPWVRIDLVVYVWTHIHICVYVCVCVCTYLYTYIYIYIHIYRSVHK